MYPVLPSAEGGAELFHRRTRTDYSPKHNIKYVPPPVSKDIHEKSTFVHNCIANKNKSNIGHFDNIYNKKVFTADKHKIIRIMHSSGVDFRRLTQLKNALFDSDDLMDNHLVPLKTFHELKEQEMR
jgi:hypothetical protein|tara:strand:+ start:318 stop:695 length:378 start_codon:yes stop_codon:yes gene_type:complete